MKAEANKSPSGGMDWPASAYLSTPMRPTNATRSESIRHNDSGISPGNTASDCADAVSRKRDSESDCAPEAGSASPFSESGLHSCNMDMDEELDEELDEDELDEDPAHLADEDDDDVVGDALSRLQRALDGSRAPHLPDTGSVHPLPAEEEDNGYQCHLCSYSAGSRFHFQAHLNTHFDVKCTHCDFTARTEGKLRAHVRTAHGDVTPDDTDETGIRIPRVNAQGKIKTHKCKQCQFVAVTKLDFWEHSRTHIKAEKLLTW